MKAPLFLSRRNADNPVVVPVNVTEKLNDYDINAVRHIYKYFQKHINVILNTECEMNEALQIYAFLAAVKTLPTLIVCSDSEISKWQCVFETEDEFNMVILETPTSELPERENMIVLAPHSILRRALHLRETTWSLLVVQNIDAIIDLPSLKKLKAKFAIAFTRHNFVLTPNKQLFIKIVNWVTNNKIVVVNEFFVPNQWLRLSWHQEENQNSVMHEVNITNVT